MKAVETTEHLNLNKGIYAVPKCLIMNLDFNGSQSMKN